jgi:hypothetical protein
MNRFFNEIFSDKKDNNSFKNGPIKIAYQYVILKIEISKHANI